MQDLLRHWLARLGARLRPGPAPLCDDDIRRLRTKLGRAGLDPSTEELADLLWLAARIGRPEPAAGAAPARGHGDRTATADKADKGAGKHAVRDPNQPRQSRKPPRQPRRGRDSARLLPDAGGAAGRRSGVPVRAPRVHPLPNGLEIGRALRPLHRRIPSRREQRLDEESTVNQYADQRAGGDAVLAPVMRPARERWYELLLVVDLAASMRVWLPMVQALHRLLGYNGAFARVRLVSLDAGSADARLYSGLVVDPADAAPGAGARRVLDPAALTTPDRRRAVMVLSDCVAPAWHTGSVVAHLRPLAGAGPLALVQMLPPRLWFDTALGYGVATRVAAAEPGSLPVARGVRIRDLDVPAMSAADPSAPESGAAAASRPSDLLPILTLEAASIRAWARLLAGHGGATLPAVRFETGTAFLDAARIPAVRRPDASEVRQRLQDFLHEASPKARALAGLVSAVPLTLDVIRLVQRTHLPDTGQSHLAELFVSGLLRREPALDLAGGEPFFDFHPRVRRALMDLTTTTQSLAVLRQLSNRIQGHFGHALDFAALLELPGSSRARQAVADLAVALDDRNTRHFAGIAATVIARLGGRYARIAAGLEAVAAGDAGLLSAALGADSQAPASADLEPPPQPREPIAFQDQLLQPLTQTNGSTATHGPEMIWLPGGEFTMGSPGGIGRDEERPAHRVRLDHYAVGKAPITVGEFGRFVEATGYETEAEKSDGAYVWSKGWDKVKDANWRNPYMDQDDSHPVTCVSWNDAMAYCEWLGKQTGQLYGLLTEAQWEHACRGGSESLWCCGDEEEKLAEYAWYNANAGDGTHPVATRKPNGFGLHDLHGNVWEWCADWYAEDTYAGRVGSVGWTGGGGDARLDGPHSGPYEQPAADAGQSGRLGRGTRPKVVPAGGPAVGPPGVGPTSASDAASDASGTGETPSGLRSNASENPSGPGTGSDRVIRGGSWLDVAVRCRSAYRVDGLPSLRNRYLGFRLSRTGPLHSYPFTLGRDEADPPAVPDYLADLRDPLADGSQGPAMVWLRGGDFTMGQDDSTWGDEKPAHRVRVSAFSVGQFPVTFAEYDRFCEATKRKKPGDEGWGRGRRPVINISWDDANAYCDWLNAQQQERHGHYRLLTEAEWEYACRSGSTDRWGHGDDERGLGEHAWYRENAMGKTHPVGEKRSNAWQLYDMHGNVWEWCADWSSADYYQQLASEVQRVTSNVQHDADAVQQDANGPAAITGEDAASATGDAAGATAAAVDPTGPGTGSNRVFRGGSWLNGADYCRSAVRRDRHRSDRGDFLGFRLSRTGSWPSYPFTLVGDAKEQPVDPGEDVRQPRDDDAVRQPAASAPGQAATPETGLATLGRFRDRFVIVRRDGRSEPASAADEGPEMVYLPGGTFSMGDEQGNGDEKPVHSVQVSAFAIGRTPVTWGQYRDFCQDTDGHWPEWLEKGSEYHLDDGNVDYYPKRGVARDAVDLPVVGIAWQDAVAYCEWLAERTGKGYRLPTEAEWEYACRAGTASRYSFGDDDAALERYGWFDGNSDGRLQPVAAKEPNPCGLYDMHGNVWEWCGDWYDRNYYKQLANEVQQDARNVQHDDSDMQQDANRAIGRVSSAAAGALDAAINPTGPATGSFRVIRGGSWSNGAGGCRSAFRDDGLPSFRLSYLGFRLSRTV